MSYRKVIKLVKRAIVISQLKFSCRTIGEATLKIIEISLQTFDVVVAKP